MPAINTSLILPLPFQQQTEVDTSAIPQSFMRAYEMAQQRSDPLNALRRASIEMDLTAKSFEISKHFEDRQRLLDAESQARQAAPSIQSLLQQQKPYEALLALQTEAAKNPNLLNSPTWNSLGKTVSTSAEISDKLKDTEARVLRDREAMRHNLAMETRGSPATQDAETLSQWKQQLRESEARVKAMGDVAEVTPELSAELEKQQTLKDKIAPLAIKTATVEPEIVVVDGVKFLVNKKNGHWERLDKTVSRQQFIAQNATKWLDQFGTPEAAAEKLGEFYDKNLATGNNATPAPAPATAAQKKFKWVPGQGVVLVE